MGDRQDIKPVIPPSPACIKQEGQPPIVRLASFRVPRDLTLGGPNAARRGGLSLNAQARGKKNFTPNLNVQRNKPKEEQKVKEEPVRRERNSLRGRGRGDRGRGRNIIQQSGVFSEGMGSAEYRANRSRLGGDGGGGGDAYVIKPKVDFKATLKADVKEEEARLKLLLRDDFIDDPDVDESRAMPIQLPISAKAQTQVKTVIKEANSGEEIRNGLSLPGIKIKAEPLDEDAHISDVSNTDRPSLEASIGGMVDFLSKKEPEFILFQLPDCLPGLRPTVEPDPKMQGQGSTAKINTEDKLQQQQCTLSTLSDSQIGKIELLRSGAARMRIGDLTFPVSVGTQASFRQDVVAVELDDSTKAGNMINLGPIKNRMIAPPDWNLLLSRFSGNPPGESSLYQMPKS